VRTRGFIPKCVPVPGGSGASTAPCWTTIVRPASVDSRRRSTRSSASPSRIFAPSRSGDGAVRRTPSRNVPWLEPASSSTASAVIRACIRETEGSASSSETPGARPIVNSPTTGTRVASASTSSSGAAEPPNGVPQLPQ
jgi:hypothetical protein